MLYISPLEARYRTLRTLDAQPSAYLLIRTRNLALVPYPNNDILIMMNPIFQTKVIFQTNVKIQT